MTAQILTFPSPFRHFEADLRPLFESAEAILAQAEADATAGQPSLSDAESYDIAHDVEIQVYARSKELGLCPLVDMVPFWMRAAVAFPRVTDGVRGVWRRKMAS